MDKIKAFILAAGLGERLRPITEHIPKPLLPVLGRPVLEHVIERVSRLPLNKIGINCSYKKEAIEKFLRGYKSLSNSSLTLFPEEPVLGTGGALKNAEGFLKGKPFLVHNSDIISDIDLKALLKFHLSSKNLVTLAVHDYPEFNNLRLDSKGFLKAICKSRKSGCAAFTGISVYSPEFLRLLPDGYSNVTDAWLRAIEEGNKIGTMDVSGCYWQDIGTPASYARVVFDALRKEGETVYIHPGSNGCAHADMDGYIVLEEGSLIQKGVSLRNCIVLPQSRIRKGHYENRILGAGIKVEITVPLPQRTAPPTAASLRGGTAFLIGTGGSDRKYYRIKRKTGTAVLMKCLPGDPDFKRHMEYTDFFRKHSVPVPRLIDADFPKKTASFEDFGDMSLYSWLKCPRDEAEIEKTYRKVIDALLLIHGIPVESLSSECPLLKERVFDYAHLRWETEYFIERFVKGIKGIEIKNRTHLEDDFHRLALKADSFAKTIIHRDFQSQNIMIKKHGPGLLDYQGARVGPPAYDIASLLWDPYSRLKEKMRNRLIDYYNAKAGGQINKKGIRDAVITARLQRHMQALGAYGFLSSKGKRYFLKHIAEGVRLLKEDIALSEDAYPALYELIMRL